MDIYRQSEELAEDKNELYVSDHNESADCHEDKAEHPRSLRLEGVYISEG